MTKYATDGKLGVSFGRVDNTTDFPLGPCFPLGTPVSASDGSMWLYCLLPTIVQIGSVCVIDAAFAATLATTAASAKGNRVGVAPAVATAGNWGWLQISGVVDNLYVGASCAANVVLNTTATGGMLDDDATSGAKVITGAIVTTARAASNGVAPGLATGLSVGATL